MSNVIILKNFIAGKNILIRMIVVNLASKDFNLSSFKNYS